MYIMWALQYIHDYMSKWHIHVYCWALHTKWYPSMRIEVENRLNGGEHLHHAGIAMHA